jgi:hypothetical protein
MKRIAYFCLLICSTLFYRFYIGDFHMPDHRVRLFTPSQKSVITIDSKKETMILSVAFKSHDISNFGRVIPIRLNEKTWRTVLKSSAQVVP